MATVAKIGDIKIIAVTDGQAAPVNPAWPFPNVPAESWRHADYALDHEARHLSNFGAFVVLSQSETVLIDTGLGPGAWEDQAPNADAGHLLRNLFMAGIKPDSITCVVLTHLHFDHVGWNVVKGEAGSPRPAFPRARYVAPKADWDHWQVNKDPAASHHQKAFRDSVMPLQRQGVLELVDGETAVAPGVRTLPTPGHTPGHQSMLLESEGERGVVTGDVVHSSAQFAHPDWSHRADIDPVKARNSRGRLLEKMLPDVTVAAGHLLHGSNIGVVARVNGRKTWRPFP